VTKSSPNRNVTARQTYTAAEIFLPISEYNRALSMTCSWIANPIHSNDSALDDTSTECRLNVSMMAQLCRCRLAMRRLPTKRTGKITRNDPMRETGGSRYKSRSEQITSLRYS